jgi:hypothetical protein
VQNLLVRGAFLFAIASSLLPAQEQQTCASEKAPNDDRCTMEASAYIGLAIDTFAAKSTQQYLYTNLSESSGQAERAVGGFDFAYRLGGWPRSKTGENPLFNQQLWVYGETVHGVRSSDVDCKANPDFPACAKALTDLGKSPGTNLLYILRNATSLEGYMGLRWEFLSLNSSSETPANVYLKAQAGFLKVSGQPDSALALHHIGLGAIATKGNYQDSYLEAGWGRSDLFQINRRRRFKVDGYLSRKIASSTLKEAVSFFAQINVDTDLGAGADSIQSYIGLNFDLGKLFGQ